MIIRTTDNKRYVDVGKSDSMYSLYSTISMLVLPNNQEICKAVDFIKEGKCTCDNALDTAREMNRVRDLLSQIPPTDVIYDMQDLSKKAPWSDNISPVVTSCGNLFLTADGKDLLFELVSLLTYSYYGKSDIIFE